MLADAAGAGRRRVSVLVAAAVCCILTVACSGYGKCKPPVPAGLDSEQAAFYRHSNEQSVYRVSKKTYCLVISEKQMAAFGGFPQVRVVPPSVDFKRGKSPVAGLACPTP